MTLLSEIYDVVHSNRECCSPRATLAQNLVTNHDYNCDGLAPVANFTADVAAGNTPLIVTFSDLSSGEMTSYLWNFGDGTTSTEANPSHVYSAVGEHTVTLTVTGPAGSNTKTRTNYIGIVIPPEAEFVADKTAGVGTLDVQFTDQSTGIILYYDWDFGDGTVASGERSVGSYEQNPMHTFTAPGSYTIKLKVTGSGTGDIDEVTKVDYIKINVDPPVANFVANKTSGGIPFTVQFTGSTEGTITDYLWNFGDGQTSTELSPSHTYSSVGTYTVTFTATGPGGSDVETKSNYITAEVAPVAAFTSDKTSGGSPLTVQFTDQSTGPITTRRWNFGDGYTSTATSPLHVYNTSGTYTVSLTVTGPGGVDIETKTALITVTKALVIPFDQASKYIQENSVNGTVVTDDIARLFSVDTLGGASFTGGVINSTYMHGAYEVAVQGDYAYVAGYFSNALAVVDISDPASPVVVGGVIDGTYLNHSYAIKIQGSYAYVAGYSSASLAVVDISDPTSPVVVGGIISGTYMGGAWGVSVQGDYAYVAGYSSNSLAVVDISDPTAPIVVGGVIDTTYLYLSSGVSVQGDYAYVSSIGRSALAVVDISDPTIPVVVGGVIDTTYMNGAMSVSTQGDYAYIVGYNAHSLAIVDITDPTSPVFVGGVIDTTYMWYASVVAVQGDYAYVSGRTSNSLAVINISAPTSPTVVGGVINGTYLHGATGVAVQDNYAYVTAFSSASLSVIDLSSHNYTTTQPYYVTTSDQSHANVSALTKISTVDIVSTEPASTTIKGIVSFDGRNTWRRWNGSAWTLPGTECVGGVPIYGTQNEGYGFFLGLAACAFDDDPATFWESTGALPNYIGYDFGSGNEKVIISYSLQAAGASSDHNTYAPRDFIFQGSNDNSNWTNLDTHTDVYFGPSEIKEFNVSNSTSFRYYRIYVTNTSYANPTYAYMILLPGFKMHSATPNGYTLGSLQQGNTVAEIEAGLTNLNISSYNSIDFAFDLATSVGTATPVIDDIIINIS